MSTETVAVDFKSATLYAIRLVLQRDSTDALIDALEKRMKDAGTFFENEPVVIDASKLESLIDWKKLTVALKANNLPVIGVVAEGSNLAAAKKLGLTAVELSASPSRSAGEAKTAAAVAEAVSSHTPVPVAPPAAQATQSSSQAPAQAKINDPIAPPAPSPVGATMVVRGPLRSGQRVYARHSDLIVMGLVSQGAEVIADGNIHIYGPLRGKAMAGARGDTSARIFTTKLEPELVAVAGVYRVIDGQLAADVYQKPAMVYLDGDTLNIKPLDH
jgi:septum site-determining protein MinC